MIGGRRVGDVDLVVDLALVMGDAAAPFALRAHRSPHADGSKDLAGVDPGLVLARCASGRLSPSGVLVASLDTGEALRDTDPGFSADNWYWQVSVYAAEPTWRARTLRRRMDDRTAPLIGRGVLYPTIPNALTWQQRDTERAAAWASAQASAPPAPEIWASDPEGRLAPFPVTLVDGDRPGDLVALYALDVQPGVDNQRHMLVHPFDAAHPRPTPGGPPIEVGVHVPAPGADADEVRSAVLSGRRAPERVLRLDLKGPPRD